MSVVKRENRVSERIKDSAKEGKRNSKLFYVSCDYLEVNTNKITNENANSSTVDLDQLNNKFTKSSDEVHILVDQDLIDKQRKKLNRRSKLFYVSCEHVEVGGQVLGSDLSKGKTNLTLPDYLNNSLDSLSSVLYSSSESTPINSSGCSTPNSVKRRPKQPNILLPSNHGVYQDYVEIRRAESISSCYSESDRNSIISDTSFFDLSEEINENEAIPKKSKSTFSELEETLTEFDVSNQMVEGETKTNEDCLKFHQNKIKMLCAERPNSPTSNFLASIISLESSTDIISQIHCNLSPLLHKVKKLEEQSKTINSLQVKLAVIQEEKRQLSSMLEKKRQQLNEKKEFSEPLNVLRKREKFSFSPIYLSVVGFNQRADKFTDTSCDSAKVFKDVGVQKSLNYPVMKDIGINVFLTFLDRACQTKTETNDFSCQNDLIISSKNQELQTDEVILKESSVGDDVAEKFYSNSFTQVLKNYKNQFTQCHLTEYLDKSLMAGCSTNDFIDVGSGDSLAEIFLISSETQTCKQVKNDQATQCSINTLEKSLAVGCSYANLKTASSQCLVDMKDFQCGDNFVKYKDASSNVDLFMKDAWTSSRIIETKSTYSGCEVQTCNIGVSDCSIFDVFCDRCSNLNLQNVGVGEYVNNLLCCVDDKMCGCFKPTCISVAISNDSVNDVFCDHCKNLKTSSTGVGDDKIDDVFCDKCNNLKTLSCGVGDCTIDNLLCDRCSNKTFFDIGVSEDSVNNSCCTSCTQKSVRSIGIGEGNINDTFCSKCIANEDKFVFDIDILKLQQPALCHYCGNKVDLNDTNLDESLQAMRDSMHNFASGMKRSTVSRSLNLESCDDSFYKSKDDLESPEDDYRAIMSDEEDDANGRGKADVIESCKMLHAHFSGENQLKQPAVLQYMSIIQALWFKTVKRKRANAAIVKSYIDLFQQRVPELLETIMNMSDDEGNTALHFAITYKNYAVVNILLDSGECSVDTINQSGYSPIMMACLTGFENKSDKYIMQRLFRMGDINKPVAETGETPLMLAVSHGHIGVVELLLDVGCDINAIDDDGATALMCACDHGNVNIVKTLLGNPDCDVTIEDNEGSTALSIAMDARRKDLALLIYGTLNFDARGRIKLSPSKQSLLGLGRRSPSPVIGRK
ncbi:uncharacterized protein LOC100203056 isoform X2 [Hydra vulgaris]|uniref:uncharacterized protein LOC100203056 isoform X2 n=1 Tax=Hydra vulgaris TaxID=6087 RepID=UPI001F5F506F|nr:uncharacterized protein LOC100203056 isoform X2 [Hydra vulgaris]